MRIVICLLLLSTIGNTASAQIASTAPGDSVRVRMLMIDSNDLSTAMQQNIIDTYQGRNQSLEELTSCIRRDLRDMGYANARVETPQLTTMALQSTGQPVDVAVQVSAGAIYHLSRIRFERISAFPDDVLRTQFPIADGDIFKGTAITDGLEKLKDLYTSQGYINFGAIPKVQYDEAQHTLALVIELDEGGKYYFGHLNFDGTEPNQGTFNKLLATWSSIEGKPYDNRILEKWLVSNATFLSRIEDRPEKVAEKYLNVHINEESHRIDAELRIHQKQ